MSMQKRMCTRAVSLWPQMHLYVPATDMWKSKEDDSYDAPEYESQCSDLDEAEY